MQITRRYVWGMKQNRLCGYDDFYPHQSFTFLYFDDKPQHPKALLAIKGLALRIKNYDNFIAVRNRRLEAEKAYIVARL
jgi:hypothetical protein